VGRLSAPSQKLQTFFEENWKKYVFDEPTSQILASDNPKTIKILPNGPKCRIYS
jgi:hypothetical protein